MGTVISKEVLADLTGHFKALSSVVPLHPVRSESEYDRAVLVLNQLLDAGAADENHVLANLANTLGALIGEYEDIQHPLPKVSPVDTLRFLMEQHQLSQADLPEVGSQGVISELLNGKRELNLRQVRALAEKFKVPSSVFV